MSIQVSFCGVTLLQDGEGSAAHGRTTVFGVRPKVLMQLAHCDGVIAQELPAMGQEIPVTLAMFPALAHKGTMRARLLSVANSIGTLFFNGFSASGQIPNCIVQAPIEEGEFRVVKLANGNERAMMVFELTFVRCY